ncbi:MAG: hypothetical protein O3A53_18690, partial [Acidobacteria bacterium]|nr:hypothetical protein [Acidobacteriota bacterium]MDA1236813.1 hypothetical protein [Acidobacteriota bacterium]
PASVRAPRALGWLAVRRQIGNPGLNYIYLGEKHMLKIQQLIVRLVQNRKGQDMVEYALLAGFIAVAAGALLPGISDSISTIFSRMASVVSVAAAA